MAGGSGVSSWTTISRGPYGKALDGAEDRRGIGCHPLCWRGHPPLHQDRYLSEDHATLCSMAFVHGPIQRRLRNPGRFGIAASSDAQGGGLGIGGIAHRGFSRQYLYDEQSAGIGRGIHSTCCVVGTARLAAALDLVGAMVYESYR